MDSPNQAQPANRLTPDSPGGPLGASVPLYHQTGIDLVPSHLDASTAQTISIANSRDPGRASQSPGDYSEGNGKNGRE